MATTWWRNAPRWRSSVQGRRGFTIWIGLESSIPRPLSSRPLYRAWGAVEPRRFLESTSSSSVKAEEPVPIKPESTVVDDILEKERREALGDSIAENKTTHPPRPLFPWRHEELLLPRLVPGTPEYRDDVGRNTRSTAQNAMAFCFCQVPWWKFWETTRQIKYMLSSSKDEAMLQSWDRELANNASYALNAAVAQIMQGQVTDDKVSVQWEPTTTTEEVNLPDWSPILDRPVGDLFVQAHQSGRHQLKVRLEMMPKSAAVFSFFCLPNISRQAVQQNPELLHECWYHLIRVSENPWSYLEWNNRFIRSELDRRGHLVTTLHAQVVVFCDEVFSVQDAHSGVTLQGHADGAVRQVPHVIRLERNAESTDVPNFPYIQWRMVGNWIITDIDDLVGGRQWYDPRQGEDDSGETSGPA
jgi:hypothetical protein